MRQLLDFEVELFGEKRTDTESLPGPFKRSLQEHLSQRFAILKAEMYNFTAEA